MCVGIYYLHINKYSIYPAVKYNRTNGALLVLLVASFAICKLPSHAVKIDVAWFTGWREGIGDLFEITDIVSFTNSWLNVLVVFWFNKPLRRAAAGALCGISMTTEEVDGVEEAAAENVVV